MTNPTKDYGALLLELRRVLTGDILGLEHGVRTTDASGDSSESPAEQATDNSDQELSLGRLESRTRELREIDDALERIRDKSFGICEECAKPVPEARLEAIPYARLCAVCQRKVEESSGF